MKFEANIARDEASVRQLLTQGWRVLIVWECAIGRTIADTTMDSIENFITSDTDPFPLYRDIGAY